MSNKDETQRLLRRALGESPDQDSFLPLQSTDRTAGPHRRKHHGLQLPALILWAGQATASICFLLSMGTMIEGNGIFATQELPGWV